MTEAVAEVALGTDEEPPVTFRVPPAFFEYPLTADPEALVEDLADLAAEVYPEGDDELWLRFVLMNIPLVSEMVEAGMSYAGFCLLDVEGQRSTATVTATFVDDIPQAKTMTAKDLADHLAAESPDSEVEVITLAAGEAAVRLAPEVRRLPGEITDSGRPETLTLGKISVFFPVPDHGEIGLFELSTPCLDDWNLYSELFFNIVNTIEVTGRQTDTPAGEQNSVGGPMALPQSPPLPDPDPVVAQALFWYSSRLMDAVALRGQVHGGQQVESITCETCWAKGLRSACSARHDWYISSVLGGDLPHALPRAVASFASRGWQTEAESGGNRARAWAGDEAPEQAAGYAFRASVDSEAGTFTAEVTAPCTRAAAAADSLFG
ncbi:hypothetical protein [Streptomyces sp. NPDC048611]|uniref:hypothetical protein n=1 Tax=Streptomyces sp. NPDC048611 TaxID=3155635 RepID=UPI00342A2B04